MDTAMERKTTTARALYEAVTAYINDNHHSRDVAERWLSYDLEPRLAVISAIMNGQPRKDDLPAIEAFRAEEIRAQICAKQKEIEKLQRDLKNVRPVTPA